MPRRGRKEPLWPFLLVIGMVLGGLAIGRLVPNELGTDEGLGVASDTGAMEDADLPSPEDRTRVEVLNGSGVPGMAAEATELLRASGLDVVYFGNATSFDLDSSVVLDRTERDGAAEVVTRTLGILPVRVEPDTTRLVDLTVVLGLDWADRSAGVLADPAALQIVSPDEARPWWDVRRFFDGGQ
jgi:hypothetical protein